jgi:hypothetical protein
VIQEGLTVYKVDNIMSAMDESDESEMKRTPTDEERMEYLKVCREEIERFHRALWEEEKHYTWWIYILFGGILAVSLSSLPIFWKALFVVFLALGGIYFCNVARMVVAREYGNLVEAFRKYNQEIEYFNLASDNKITSSNQVDLSCRGSIKLLVKAMISKNKNRDTAIADWFVVTFKLAKITFIISIAVAIIVFFAYKFEWLQCLL